MKTLFCSFTATARLAMLAVCALLCAGFASCSSDDDEPDGDSVPAELIGTWNFDDELYITFNKNGQGYIEGYLYDEDEDEDYDAARRLSTRAASMQRVNFTYTYNAATRQLALTMQGETEVFTIQSLSASQLVLLDEDGDEMTGTKSQSSDSETTTVDMSKIYGTWVCANLTLTFNKETQVATVDYGDGEKQSTGFTVSGNVIYFEDGGHLTVASVTDTQLTFSDMDVDDEPTTVTFTRKSDTEDQVGDVSLLVNKTWAYVADHDMIQFYFNSNGTCTFKDEEDVMTMKWSYDTDTHKITLSEGGETMVMEVINLTDEALTLNIPGEEDDGTIVYTEFDFVAI